jgi:hypothetical protein
MKRLMWFSLLLAVLSPVATRSATLRVPSEYATINAALDASVSGDTVLVAAGTYTDYEVRMGPFGLNSSCAFLRGGVVLCSEAGPEATTLDMVEGVGFLDVVRAFRLEEEVVVSGFTITSPLAGVTGMLVREGAKGTIQDCIFRDLGTGQTNESGVEARVNDVEVIGSTFRNIDGGTGAAIAQGDGTLLVEDCWFENCQEGAISCKEDLDTRVRWAVIRNSTFLDNISGGGAVFVRNYNSVVIESCWFEGNTAENGGGGASPVGTATPVEVRGCVFLSNQTLTGRGGGLYVSGDSHVTGNTFFNCSQEYPFGGSAAAFYGGHTDFLRNILASCHGGSAVTLETGTITTDCNVFWDNPDGDVENFSMGPNDHGAERPNRRSPVLRFASRRPDSSARVAVPSRELGRLRPDRSVRDRLRDHLGRECDLGAVEEPVPWAGGSVRWTRTVPPLLVERM